MIMYMCKYIVYVLRYTNSMCIIIRAIPKFYFKYVRSSTNIIIILINYNSLYYSIYRVYLVKKPRYIIAEVCHFENGPVITASSSEWALKKQLYRYRDLLESRSSVVIILLSRLCQ